MKKLDTTLNDIIFALLYFLLLGFGINKISQYFDQYDTTAVFFILLWSIFISAILLYIFKEDKYYLYRFLLLIFSFTWKILD